MELQVASWRHELSAALTHLLNREVSLSVSWGDGPSPLVCLAGRLEGLVDVPGGSDAPLSIVVGGQDILLWPEDLAGAGIERSPDQLGFSLRLTSGVVLSADPTD